MATTYNPSYNPVYWETASSSLPIDTDVTLSSPSDAVAPSQLAVKTYIDAKTWVVSDITDLGTMGSQDATAVAITGGTMDGVTITGGSIPNTVVTGLGTMSTQNAGTVAITGGTIDAVAITNGSVTSATISGGTVSGLSADLAITDGGTGAGTSTAAFDNLSPTTTKGDVIVSNGTNNVRQAVGADGEVIVADSTQASGIKWGKDVPINNTNHPAGRLLLAGSSNDLNSTENLNYDTTNNYLNIDGDGAGSYIHFTNNITGQAATDGAFVGYSGSDYFEIDIKENKDFVMSINGGIKARLDSSGRFVVGSTNPPINTLQVNGDGSSTGLSLTGATTYGFGLVNVTGSTDRLEFGSYNSSYVSNVSNILNLLADGRVSIGGATNPDSWLHVHKATAGIVQATADSVVTVENSGDASLSILTPDANSGNIYFGSPTDNDNGGIVYSHSDNTMDLRVNGATRVQIKSNGGIKMLNLEGSSPTGLKAVYFDTGTGNLYYDNT